MNAYPNGEKFYRQSRRIAEELKGIGIETEIRRTSEIDAAIRFDGRAEAVGGFDFAVYLDKDKYLGRILEKAGMRLFNSSEAVERCDDKMLTYLALSDSGIEIPESVSAPLCYTPGVHPDESFLSRTAAKLGFPLVAKKSFGSFGKDVRLIRTMDELRTTEKDFLYCPHFYQRYLAESAGRDIRVIVIGGRAVAAMERRAQKGNSARISNWAVTEFASDSRNLSALRRKKRLKRCNWTTAASICWRRGPNLCFARSIPMRFSRAWKRRRE